MALSEVRLRRALDLAAAAAAAGFVWAAYAPTICKGIPGGDSGELVAEACLLGVAHPPGYPTFVLAARAAIEAAAWAYGPGAAGSPARRVNAASAGLGAATAGALALAGAAAARAAGRAAAAAGARARVPRAGAAALAAAAGAAAVVLFNDGNGVTNLAPPDVYLSEVSKIPVFVTSYAVGAQLYAEATTGRAPVLALGVQGEYDPHRADYNLIADSPYGDPTHVIVAEGHLDAIFGAGMLDNASGSTTILELALTLARTPTRNQMRYVWFGGEEIGLLGSAHYTQTLGPDQLAHIAFDLDADVTATANVDYLIANPAYASNASSFPPNVAPESVIGNQYFEQYFAAQHVYAIDGPRAGGNNGTDSNSFSLVGVPNSGVFTGQDCCRSLAAVNLWGGYLGNREGHVPGYDGGCVDYIGRWCDNLANNDPVVLERVSKGFAYVAAELANHAFDATPATARRPAAQPAGTPVGPRLSPPHRGALSAQ